MNLKNQKKILKKSNKKVIIDLGDNIIITSIN